MLVKYATLARLRELGISDTHLPDADALIFIRKVSESLNGLTKQFFSPLPEIHKASGKGSRIIHRQDLVPIIDVASLQVDVDNNRSNYYTGAERVFGRNLNAGNHYDLTRFQISPETNYRLLSLLFGEFPRGVQNVVMNGIFGWLEGRKTFEGELNADLDAADAAIDLVDVLNTSGWIEVGDFVVIEIQAATEGVPALTYIDIVQAISGTNLTVDAVEAQPGLPIAAGATVKSYGHFPGPLQEVMDALLLRAWETDPRNPDGGGGIMGRITSERTDNYSWQAEGPSVVASRAGGYGFITGSVRLDKVLAGYCQPPYLGFA